MTSVASATQRGGPWEGTGRHIKVGSDPVAVAFTPNSKAVYVVNSNSGTVTPISTSARKAGTAIRVGSDPDAIAVSPNGQTAYITNSGSSTVTPITTATGKAGQPIPVGMAPSAIAILFADQSGLCRGQRIV